MKHETENIQFLSYHYENIAGTHFWLITNLILIPIVFVPSFFYFHTLATRESNYVVFFVSRDTVKLHPGNENKCQLTW